MKFPPSFLDEIRARLPVSEVVGQTVKLKKQGREWIGLSPFGAEKSPSFTVNDQKGFYHDFSSGKHGDVFKFLMETQGLGFPEAVERAASMAGLSMPTMTPEAAAQEKRRATTQEALELAAQFFEAQLRGSEGARARQYLIDRGLGAKAVEAFRIGYSPNQRYALRDFLAAKGCSAETMIEAGLLIHGEDIAVPYDRFRDRVMFPICDRGGKVIAFGGRAMDKQAQAKYLNSPETPLFHKGACLYNLHNARKSAHDNGAVVAVEGYVDVISMTLAGFPHVVAPLGTALTPDQCELLWKMAEEPILCFDGDKAGRKAAFRAIDTALPLIAPGKSLRFALLPEGQDPDDLARAGGAEAVAAALDSSKPLVELLFLREAEAQTLDTPERRAGLERRLREAAGAIRDENLRRHYLEDLRARLDQLFGRQSFDRSGRGQNQNQQGGLSGRFAQRGARAKGGFARFGEPENLKAPLAASPALLNSALFAPGEAAMSPRETMILLILLNHPNLMVNHAEEIAALDLASRPARDLRDCLLALAAPGASHEDLRSGVESAGLDKIRLRIESNTAISSLWCVKPDASESDAEAVLRQALGLHRKSRALHKEMQLALGAFNEEPNERNLARLVDIRSQLSTLEGAEAALEGFGAASGRESKPL